MTDDLDKLRDVLKRQTPAPDTGTRDRALMAAQLAFEEKFQGSEEMARPIEDRSQEAAGFLKGVSAMFDRLTSRHVLLTTSSIATVAFAFVITSDMQWRQPELAEPETVGTATSELKSAVAAQEAPQAPELLEDAASSVQYPSLADPADEADDGYLRRTQADLAYAHAEAETAEEVAATPRPVVRPEQLDLLATELPLDADDGSIFSAEISGIMDQEEAELAASPAPAEAPQQFANSPQSVPNERPEPERRIRDATALQKLSVDAPLGRVQGNEGMLMPPPPEQSTETFPETEPNAIKSVAEEPVSTFSIDVDTASYSYIRSALMSGQKPNPSAVRIEEMVNYFDYDYPAPDSREVPFTTSVSVIDTPWNEGTKLMHIGIQGYEIPVENRPPVNLVFLIDTSGSMSDANKLPLLIQSFRLLLGTLRDEDSVAIVTYAGSAGMVLEPTPASEKSKILTALENLHAGGSTAGQAGLQQAYALAEDMHEDGEISRVILATDGDFNVGISDPDALKTFIEDKRDSGTYLSVLGFGRGNYQDATMQALAQNGNGTAAYIDTLAEAQKVLVEETGGALFPIANDVKIQVEFNPAMIAEYRLLGYETRALNREDFNNDAVDAGEIGAGHTVTAIYEITPVGSPAISVDPLRYSSEETQPTPIIDPDGEFGYLKLRYKNPGESTSILIETPLTLNRADIAASETAFASAVAGFGELLRGSNLVHGFDYDDVSTLAAASRGEDPFGYRAEFRRLVQLAKTAQ